ncbi:MAG: PLP-dependent aminotransferase family protein [Betaproteobacteria bacterium]
MNASAPEFVYLQLARQVADAIVAGALVPGERLPSVRALAERERVSVATALAAYRHLENRRLVDARPKSGYFVCLRAPRLREPEARAVRRAPAFVGVNRLVMEILEASHDPDIVALGAACPSASLFPTGKLQRLLSAQTRRRPERLAEYRMGTGVESLRQQIARRAFAVGCRIEPENVIITNGCMEALNIALRAVTKPGGVVALESPTYFGVLQIVESLGLKALEIPTSPRTGLSVDALDLATRKPGAVNAVVVMPNFSNPFGCLMPDAQKKRMVELMAERDIPIIEDDIYGDLHFGDRRPKPAKAWDRTGNVMLASSFTKTLAPGLRVGWIAPGRRFAAVSMLKFITTISTEEVGQEVIAAFLANGGYDHHLRRLRQAFREQVGRMTDAIERHFPADTRVTRPAGGFVLWVELPESVDSLELFRAAAAKGVSLGPGVIFSPTGRFTHHLRVNCGFSWSERIELAVRDVGHAATHLAR